MKKQIFLLLSITLFLTITGCKKTPTAKIVLSTYEYAAGDEVSFQSSCTDYESLEWNLGDKTAVTEASPKKKFTTSGYYNIYLTAYSKKKKSFDQDMITIKIKEPEALQAIGSFYGSDCDYTYNITVTKSTVQPGGNDLDLTVKNLRNGTFSAFNVRYNILNNSYTVLNNGSITGTYLGYNMYATISNFTYNTSTRYLSFNYKFDQSPNSTGCWVCNCSYSGKKN